LSHLLERVRAIEAELQIIKRKLMEPKPTKKQIRQRIEEYRRIVKEVSKALKVEENPSEYIAKLRMREHLAE